MRHTAIAVFLGLLPGLVVAAGAQEEVAAPTTLPLESVHWAGAPVDPESFQGKSVLLFVYATWCPKCNEWSGELMAQLREAAGKKPVIVLAVNADERPSGVQRYLTQRGFFGPNIIHGYDPNIHKRLGLDSNLFHYVLLGPTGAVVDRGVPEVFRPRAPPSGLSCRKRLPRGTTSAIFGCFAKTCPSPCGSCSGRWSSAAPMNRL